MSFQRLSVIVSKIITTCLVYAYVTVHLYVLYFQVREFKSFKQLE